MGGEALMREVAEGFAVADLRPLFDAIGDDIVWRSAATVRGALPFGGIYRGRQGVVQLTSEVARAYSFQRFRPREIVSRGTVVWGLFEAKGECLGANGGARVARPFAYEFAVRWRLRRGRIVEHQGFFDTSALIRQTC